MRLLAKPVKGMSLNNILKFVWLTSETTKAFTIKRSPPVVLFPFCAFLASIKNDVGAPGAPSGSSPGPMARQHEAQELAKKLNEHKEEVRSLAPILTRTSHVRAPKTTQDKGIEHCFIQVPAPPVSLLLPRP